MHVQSKLFNNKKCVASLRSDDLMTKVLMYKICAEQKLSRGEVPLKDCTYLMDFQTYKPYLMLTTGPSDQLLYIEQYPDGLCIAVK